MTHKIFDLSLYLVLDPTLCHGKDGMVSCALDAVRNGVSMVQLRAPDWKKKEWLDCARALKVALKPFNVPLIINDQVDVALAVDADGVHIGQSDMPPEDARRLLGNDKIIGLSISNEKEFLMADASLVDYLGVGPIFKTQTKLDAAPALGLEELKRLNSKKLLPIVAIGGLSLENIPVVLATGVDGVAVVSAICGQPNIAEATKILKKLL